MGTTAQAQAGRDRARESRLKAARERRLRLDPDQLAREQRIDEAAVDVEVAWEERTVAEQAVTDAEIAAAAAIERVLAERLAVKDVVRPTGFTVSSVADRHLRCQPHSQPHRRQPHRRHGMTGSAILLDCRSDRSLGRTAGCKIRGGAWALAASLNDRPNERGGLDDGLVHG